jgi:hypothetical protein
MKKVTVVGAGYSTRKMHLRNVAEILRPDLVYVVDLLSQRAEECVRILDGLGIKSEPVVEDFTKMFDSKNNKVRLQYHPALKVDYAVLATLSDKGSSHTPLARVFDEANVPIFSEKPIASNRKELELAKSISVPSQVDYQETKSSAYRAVLDEILKTGFKPKEGVHIRSMWDPTGKPVLLTESGHDVSEIMYARKKLGLEGKPLVSVMKFDSRVPEREAKIRLSYEDATFDVATSHLLNYVGKESAIRYFAWYDGSTCYLGSTLEREYADPFAVKFANGKEAFEELDCGMFFDREIKRIFVKNHSGEMLETGKYGKNPAGEMLQELADGHPSIPISFAVDIETPLFDAYASHGGPKWKLQGSLMNIRKK